MQFKAVPDNNYITGIKKSDLKLLNITSCPITLELVNIDKGIYSKILT